MYTDVKREFDTLSSNHAVLFCIILAFSSEICVLWKGVSVTGASSD